MRQVFYRKAKIFNKGQHVGDIGLKMFFRMDHYDLWRDWQSGYVPRARFYRKSRCRVRLTRVRKPVPTLRRWIITMPGCDYFGGGNPDSFPSMTDAVSFVVDIAPEAEIQAV